MVSDALGGGRAGIWYVSFNISGPACSKIRIFRTYHGYMLRKADFFNIFILAKFRGFRTCHRNSLVCHCWTDVETQQVHTVRHSATRLLWGVFLGPILVNPIRGRQSFRSSPRNGTPKCKACKKDQHERGTFVGSAFRDEFTYAIPIRRGPCASHVPVRCRRLVSSQNQHSS
jgi:hypothetical protein